MKEKTIATKQPKSWPSTWIANMNGKSMLKGKQSLTIGHILPLSIKIKTMVYQFALELDYIYTSTWEAIPKNSIEIRTSVLEQTATMFRTK